MSIPGSASPLFFGAGAAEAAAFTLQKSVRFNAADTPELTRTPSSAGNTRKFTISFWAKRSKLGSVQMIGQTGDTYGNLFRFYWLSSDSFVFHQYNGSSYVMSYTTEAKYRDPSAWYHYVISIDTTLATAADRARLYVNGVEVTDFSAENNPAQNLQTGWNAAIKQRIGREYTTTYGNYYNYDGYLADFYNIDGQQLDCTSFGEFDDNGVWQAKDASGLTFGTNGFHLFDFANETGIGNDSSGNDNDFTVNNISTTAGAGNDVLFDVPTNGTQSDTGAGGEVSGNYCVMNPLHHLHAATLANGNLQTTSSEKAFSTFLLKTGKWYVEHKIDSTGYNLCFSQIDHPSGATPSSSNSKSIGWYIPNGYVYWGAGYSADLGGTTMTGLDSSGYMSNASVGDIIAAAIDMDNSTIKFYKNGSEVGSIDFSTGNAHRFTEGMYISQFNGYGHWNFGQRAYSYAAPSGYSPLCSTLLPTPTIANGRDHFDIALYTGNGGSSTITVSGLNFGPNLVWLKGRSDPDKHGLYDTVRGATKLLKPSSNAGESTQNGVTAFNSDGFDIGNYAETNGNNRTYVAWAWNVPGSASSNSDGTITSYVTKNADAGISIVTWTGNDSTGTIGHGLGSKPDLIIAKVYGDSSYADNWPVYSSVYDGTHYAYLNDTRVFTDFAGFWNDGTATSTVFPVGTYNTDNTKSLIAWCFTSIEGFSSFGSYEGNGSANGPFVYTGFRPALVIIKISSGTTSNWVILDSARDPDNVVRNNLYADTDDAENQFDWADFLSNGFKPRVTYSQVNGSGYDYIYLAWAENPFSSNGGLAR